MSTVIRTKSIPAGEIPEFYYQEFKLPRAGHPMAATGIHEIERDGDTVAIVDVRGQGFIDIYEICEGVMRRLEFATV